ncbi:MAG: ATP-dependent zinc protease [Hyphomicrobiaceae bacterium]|nr:ATP-dependent zinc protease [Hyphomicrobiaceae bacterium]MCC0008542.1 ATP-dependent zinc protease [Hyphomicrobiaceae bacterium]
MPEPFIIGWEEWVALPDLDLPAIKAKVDTGARTSALHAHHIEPFGPADNPLVRFAVHPIAGRTDVEVTCSAPITDRREVTSSNGERETRYVITTNARVGQRTWPIEVTLTNREQMAYRMLLGRQAIQDDMFVDPASSFRQQRLSYKLYRHVPRHDRVRRALRIALLAAQPDGPGTTALANAAAARGHVVETVPADAPVLVFDGLLPALTLADEPLGHFDIVIPRFDPTENPAAVAVLRQFEMMGSASLNPADALARIIDPVSLRQRLFAAGIPTGGPARFSAVDRGMDGRSLAVHGMYSGPAPGIHDEEDSKSNALCVLVVGHNAVAVRIPPILAASENRISELSVRQARRIAVKAARALQLRLATIDVTPVGDDLLVTGISAYPKLAEFSEATGIAIELFILADAQSEVHSWTTHTDEEQGGTLLVADDG